MPVSWIRYPKQKAQILLNGDRALTGCLHPRCGTFVDRTTLLATEPLLFFALDFFRLCFSFLSTHTCSVFFSPSFQLFVSVVVEFAGITIMRYQWTAEKGKSMDAAW
jgi:hypothetical protein